MTRALVVTGSASRSHSARTKINWEIEIAEKGIRDREDALAGVLKVFHEAVLVAAKAASAAAKRVAKALRVAMRFGQSDGADHKAWVIDQMVRELLASGYQDFVTANQDGCGWDVGIAP